MYSKGRGSTARRRRSKKARALRGNPGLTAGIENDSNINFNS